MLNLLLTCRAVTLEGKCLFNSAPLTKRLKRKIGFVLQVSACWLCYWHSCSAGWLTQGLRWQDDLLYEQLTVFETLYFAAMLRLPSNMSRATKTERVETVIKALGLNTCRNTIIGGGFVRCALPCSAHKLLLFS